MKHNLIASMISLYVLCLACAGGLQFYGFKEPTSDNTMLVVGRVIVEDNKFTSKIGVCREKIKVAILGMIENGERIGLWTNTDENGYFALADLPKGEYALKGIKVIFETGEMAIIVNPLRYPNSTYEFSNNEFFVFDGKYFPFVPCGRIINLKHNIFRLSAPDISSYPVEHTCEHELKNYKLINGEIINAEPVESYFLQKYPQSEWKKHLQESSKIIRYPR